MDNHYNVHVPKRSVTMEKKRRYAVSKNELIVQLLPPTAHHDPLRTLSEEQLNKLSPEDLVRQALKLMTNDDPQGYRATGGVSIEQCLTALIINATERAGLVLARIVREHKKGLTAVAQVNKYQKQTAARLDDTLGINENDEYDDEYHDEDIENPIFDDSDDSEVQVLSMLMATLGIETVAKAQETVPGQRSRAPTTHFGKYHGAEDRHTFASSNPKLKMPQLTMTKKTKQSGSASVSTAASGSAESGDSVTTSVTSIQRSSFVAQCFQSTSLYWCIASSTQRNGRCYNRCCRHRLHYRHS